MFWATRPYLSDPADPRLFLRKTTEPTLPYFIKTIALNTRFIFSALGHLFLIFWFTRPETVFFPKVGKNPNCRQSLSMVKKTRVLK